MKPKAIFQRKNNIATEIEITIYFYRDMMHSKVRKIPDPTWSTQVGWMSWGSKYLLLLPHTPIPKHPSVTEVVKY